MYVLDTNVISALLAQQSPGEVVAWVRAQPVHALYTTTICQAEILGGVARMPAGRRLRDLTVAVRGIFEIEFADRLLAFDGEAAAAYAEIVGLRRRARLAVGLSADLMIAAIARAHRATVVTRNTADFEACGIELENPWRA